MGYLKLHCHVCGKAWEVYSKDESGRTCPRCRAKMDGQDWERQVLPAFNMMQDANRELHKTHTGYKTPYFTVDYIEDMDILYEVWEKEKTSNI